MKDPSTVGGMSKKSWRWLRITGWILTYVVILFWGMAIVKWQIPPYGVYRWVKSVLGLPRYLGPEAEITHRFAFVNPLVESENQLDPPVNTTAQITERVSRLELDVNLFNTAYPTLQVQKASLLKPTVFSLDFELGRRYTAYTYFVGGRARNTQTAFLIIPGSGFNQSSPIFNRERHNYHDGLLDVAGKYGDVFIYIKPNEDIRAIHNGRHKLSYDFIIATLISHNSSYSAYYIVETMAVVKYLQQRYRQVVIVGVSQGGTAAFLNGLQSRPTMVLSINGLPFQPDRYLLHASMSNIMIPGLSNSLKPEEIKNRMQTQPTRWFFTIGKLDIGEFRSAAEENTLAKIYQGMDNVIVHVHPGAHEVPVPLIDNFLGKELTR